MSSIEISELLEPSVPERLRLVEAIWDSIAEHPDALPFSDAERVELDRRWTDHLKDPTAGAPWSDVKARIIKR